MCNVSLGQKYIFDLIWFDVLYGIIPWISENSGTGRRH